MSLFILNRDPWITFFRLLDESRGNLNYESRTRRFVVGMWRIRVR